MPAAGDSERSRASSSTGTEEAAQAADPFARIAAQGPGRAHAAGTVGQLREDGDRDDERGADLVERRRDRLEQPLRVGQRVGGADADHDRGQPQPVVEPGEKRLLRDRPEQPHPRDPVGQRDGRQLDQHPAVADATEEDPEGDADDHDHQPEQEVEPERPRPRVVGAARHHDERRGRHEQRQQERVGRQRRCGGRADRPDPPRHRVQVTREAGPGRRHQARVRRRAA
ncbi:hypothetical protein [Nocardioides sp. B-3]|uniref:hypothetical protein n=1 Tax=Nocardioides sp. B-3 TaxID=2895565 RepID=UPI0021522D72|nr:hypothetical protein [Nocardioides sp. B-3]UUZ59977.1 hypothetical protein LP418_02845 [Nocardioides sp. B-3]